MTNARECFSLGAIVADSLADLHDDLESYAESTRKVNMFLVENDSTRAIDEQILSHSIVARTNECVQSIRDDIQRVIQCVGTGDANRLNSLLDDLINNVGDGNVISAYSDLVGMREIIEGSASVAF